MTGLLPPSFTRERESPAAHADILRLTQDLLLTWTAAHGGLLSEPEALVILPEVASRVAAYAEKVAAAAAVACAPWEERYAPWEERYVRPDEVPSSDEVLAREESICEDEDDDKDVEAHELPQADTAPRIDKMCGIIQARIKELQDDDDHMRSSHYSSQRELLRGVVRMLKILAEEKVINWQKVAVLLGQATAYGTVHLGEAETAWAVSLIEQLPLVEK